MHAAGVLRKIARVLSIACKNAFWPKPLAPTLPVMLTCEMY